MFIHLIYLNFRKANLFAQFLNIYSIMMIQYFEPVCFVCVSSFFLFFVEDKICMSICFMLLLWTTLNTNKIIVLRQMKKKKNQCFNWHYCHFLHKFDAVPMDQCSRKNENVSYSDRNDSNEFDCLSDEMTFIQSIMMKCSS